VSFIAHPRMRDSDERVRLALAFEKAPCELPGPHVAIELEAVLLDERLEVVRLKPDRLAAALDGAHEVPRGLGEHVVEDRHAVRC